MSLKPMIPPKRFDIPPPLTGGCSEGLDALRFFMTGEGSESLDAFRFFFKQLVNLKKSQKDWNATIKPPLELNIYYK